MELYIITCTTTPFKFQQLAVSKPPEIGRTETTQIKRKGSQPPKSNFFQGENAVSVRDKCTVYHFTVIFEAGDPLP